MGGDRVPVLGRENLGIQRLLGPLYKRDLATVNMRARHNYRRYKEVGGEDDGIAVQAQLGKIPEALAL